MTRAARSQALEPASGVAIAAAGDLATIAVAAFAARRLPCRVLDRPAIAPSALGSTFGPGPGAAIGDALGDAFGDALDDGAVLGWALADDTSADGFAQLGAACGAAAAAGRPMIILSGSAMMTGRAGVLHSAALAFLRAQGAVLVGDPDAWIEAIALVALFGLPPGPRIAVVAEPGSYLAIQAQAIVAEAETFGLRPVLSSSFDPDAPTDVVLHDPRTTPARVGGARPIPVLSRAELTAPIATLVGLRASLAAVDAVGRAAERIAAGLGPAPVTASRELDVDRERFTRQLDKIGPWDRRVGDHETKVLLAAYGVPVIRQAVATTPSAALRIAKKAGFPVEVKPWGSDVASERDGCPVERGIDSAAELRRAYLAVLGGDDTTGSGPDAGAVIIRESPPRGRELSATFMRLDRLGWACVLEVPGTSAPAVAPAPLRLYDATQLANHVPSTRSGDPEPDRVALANLLRRASHLVVDLDDRIERLELGRIVVGGPRTVVVDAVIDLRSRS